MQRRALVDPVRCAKSAGLRYVTDGEPGIRREVGPLGFRYRSPSGRIVRDAATLRRIRALAIPPAWTDVWICRNPRGHVQATGRDVRGRKQYRYHSDWRVRRDETKFHRMQAFATALPCIRERALADCARRGLPREKVLAAVVQLLEKSLIRVGNDEYAKSNGSFGLTTLRDRHVDVRGGTLRFQFRGKAGKHHSVDISDRRLAKVVRQCRDLPGQELFQYVDQRGRCQRIDSADVNRYLKEVTGEEFTAKDFRTWAGTVLAATALREGGAAASMAAGKRYVIRAIEAVAGMLGNTRAVCRRSYIHPLVIDAYMDGSLHAVGGQGRRGSRQPSALRPDEQVVVALLRRGMNGEAKKRAA